MKILFFIFCSHLFLFKTLSYAQVDSSAEKLGRIDHVLRDAKNIPSTVLFAYKRPFSWKKKEWGIFALVSGITIASSFADESVNRFFQNNKSSSLDKLADVGDYIGRPNFNAPLYIGFYGLGFITKNDWIRTTSAMVFTSMAVSGLIQTITKDAVGRARPNSGLGNDKFKPFGGRAYHSFPSGHSLLSVSTMWVIARQVNFTPIKIIFYALPAVVSWSRIYDEAHWLSDVLLGNALAIAGAEAVLKYFPKITNNNGSHKGISLLPSQHGLSLRYSF